MVRFIFSLLIVAVASVLAAPLVDLRAVEVARAAPPTKPVTVFRPKGHPKRDGETVEGGPGGGGLGW